uniref:Maestro heat-like repeat-containing protein family member 1 n=1 Tax=Trichogramma kaykai TaxID=54128 RepID=A0ABD2XLD7_9HYME
MTTSTIMEDDEANNKNTELSAIVEALLVTLNDKDETVHLSVVEALKKIAKIEPITVIESSVKFWKSQRKTDVRLNSLLKILTDIIEYHVIKMDHNLATSVADLALLELEDRDFDQAIKLLVSLTKVQCPQVIGALIIRFEPNVVPHHKIIETIGDIAEKYPTDMLPFIKVTLSVLTPLMSGIKEDQAKYATASTLKKISDAISDCLTNSKLANSGLNKDIYYEELSTAFEVLCYNWLRVCRVHNLTEKILFAMASILPLLPQIADDKLIIRLIPILLNFCKKPSFRYSACSVLSILLVRANNEVKEILRPYLDQLHQILLDMVSATPFEAVREVLLTHYEVLQCFRAIVILFPDEGLDRVLHLLKSQNTNQRSRALVVIRHLVNTLPPEDEVSLQKIAVNLQDSLSEGNTRLVVGAIVALAARPKFPVLPTQRSAFIKFMVLHCGTRGEEGEACEEALHLLSSTVHGAELWLWPALVAALLDTTYYASAAAILRALDPLAQKILPNEEHRDRLLKDFRSVKVLGRCLELLEQEQNRVAVLKFLRSAAPLFGQQQRLHEHWSSKLAELVRYLEDGQRAAIEATTAHDRLEQTLAWEDRLVEFLEESRELEGDAWASELAQELAQRRMSPSLAICFASVAQDSAQIASLIQLVRQHSVNSQGTTSLVDEYARAVGICARGNGEGNARLELTLRLVEEYCNVEDARKQPLKLLGFMRDAKQAASLEAAKAGLLHAYAEICRQADAGQLMAALERHVMPWAVRQLQECRELGTKEAGLLAVEQCALAPHRLDEPRELAARPVALQAILQLFQSSNGARPLQIYPLMLKAIIALIKLPPLLSSEDKRQILESCMDKVIGASEPVSQLSLPGVAQQIVDSLAAIGSELVANSADTLALLADVLLPWMQSRSEAERRCTLLVLRSTLRTYHDSLKYTYPGGKLEPGLLLGRFLGWAADSAPGLRPLVVDCVALALNIGARHRSTAPDNALSEDVSEAKRIIISEDNAVLFKGVRNLALASCQRVASAEVVSCAEGLIEGLLNRGDGGIAAGLALSVLFQQRGMDIPRSSMFLVDSVIAQIRQTENPMCRHGAAIAVQSLARHHSQSVVEHLLRQPLPLDRGCKECWRQLGSSSSDDEDRDRVVGSTVLELLLRRLESENLVVVEAVFDGLSSPQAKTNGNGNNNGGSGSNGNKKQKRPTASFGSLAAVCAMGQLLHGDAETAERLAEQQLAELLAAMLEHVAGWLHCDPPMSSVGSTKYGFVPNRASCKLDPYAEAFAVLARVVALTVRKDAVDNDSFALSFFADRFREPEEGLVLLVREVVAALRSARPDALLRLVRRSGRLVTRPLPAQRALAIALYAETLGQVAEGAQDSSVWLDAIVNTLHEAKADSSALVRKIATRGLTSIAQLEPNLVEEHFENCLSSLLDGLEEPVGATDGSADVILESLKGLAVLLSVKTSKPVSPRVVLALKPFVERENVEARLAALRAMGALTLAWQRFTADSPTDDDVTDHLLGCLPCLAVKLEDRSLDVAQAARQALRNAAYLMQCKSLAYAIESHLGPDKDNDSTSSSSSSIENFFRELIVCLRQDLPDRSEELRNAVVRGYSRSENAVTRSTSALLLGLFGEPRPDEIQRLLQLLKDQENFVRARAARGLALAYTA